MKFTDIFVKKPVLATVVSLLILVIGLAVATLYTFFPKKSMGQVVASPAKS